MQDCLRKYEINLKSIKNDKSLIAYEKLFKFGPQTPMFEKTYEEKSRR